VAILDGASVTAILPRSQGTGIAIAHADGSLDTLDVSHILLAFGRVPDLDPELLEQARLKRDPARPDFLQLSPQGQTSNGRVTAIGGAAGIYDAQSALRQAAIVLQRATGAAAGRINPLLVPRSVNTSPAIAQIGLVETANGLRPGQMVLRANASETTAARASADLPGNTKLITTSDGTILGAAMIGAHSSETIAMLALALERGMGAADLAGLLLPPASPAAQLVDLGRQFIAQHRPSDWARRRAALRRLLP
jgi:pyruvate/2-oxoglutarate dehydrogenase complex dihydrolipoamide dehydrogenase (E3) component